MVGKGVLVCDIWLHDQCPNGLLSCLPGDTLNSSHWLTDHFKESRVCGILPVVKGDGAPIPTAVRRLQSPNGQGAVGQLRRSAVNDASFSCQAAAWSNPDDRVDLRQLAGKNNVAVEDHCFWLHLLNKAGADRHLGGYVEQEKHAIMTSYFNMKSRYAFQHFEFFFFTPGLALM